MVKSRFPVVRKTLSRLYYSSVLLSVVILLYLQTRSLLKSVVRETATATGDGSGVDSASSLLQCKCKADDTTFALCPVPNEKVHVQATGKYGETLELASAIHVENLKQRANVYGLDQVTILKEWQNETNGGHLPLRGPLEYFSPTYPCFPEVRFGSWADGGKWICRPNDLLSPKSVVYSIGCNGVDSFEMELYKKTGVEIHVFDHTLKPKVKEAVMRKKAYHFHDVGIGASTNPSAKLMSLEDMMSWLNHTYIDIFKIDCEGCEYQVMASILEASTGKPPFGQVQVELHTMTNAVELQKFYLLMENSGFRLFHREPNWRFLLHVELAYVHQDVC